MKTKLKPCSGECNGELRPIWGRIKGKGYCKNCYLRQKLGEKPTTVARSPISRTSPKRAKEEVLYTVARKVFLDQHPVCGMNIKGLCTVKATEIQHLKGRGKYYLDQQYWMQACRTCHSYATDHPQEAIENGWALPRLNK